MLRAYVGAGFSPADFWHLSPRLYLAHMQGARERLEREHEARAWAVWHVAALQRTDKLPDFSIFTGRKSAERRQSAEVLTAMGLAMARAFGAIER